MATGAEVLANLLPSGGWVIYGDDFDSIIYDEGIAPVTQKVFNETFDKIDELKVIEAKNKETAQAALFERLGITADEAKLLLS